MAESLQKLKESFFVSVSRKWINHSRSALVILSTFYDWPPDSDILSNKSLLARIYFLTLSMLHMTQLSVIDRKTRKQMRMRENHKGHRFLHFLIMTHIHVLSLFLNIFSLQPLGHSKPTFLWGLLGNIYLITFSKSCYQDGRLVHIW